MVTARRVARRPLAAAVEAAVAGGVTAVMLREHDLPHGDLVELGQEVAAAARRGGALFLVNHDIAAALQLGAAGVHLGYRSAHVAEARAVLGSTALVGRSTHDLAELEAAAAAGADYVTFGPILATPSKRGLLEPRGFAALAEAVREAGEMPVVALGGLSSGDAGRVRTAGAAGLAAIRALQDTPDERAAAADLRGAWETGR